MGKAALWTPGGRGGVATVRLAVSETADAVDNAVPFRAVNGRPLAEQACGRVVFGSWGASEPAEEVVVCRVDHQTWDVHCHGGEAAVRRVLADLRGAGFAVTAWQELLASTAGAFEAECTTALVAASTRRAAEILLEQVSGTLKSALVRLREASSGGARAAELGNGIDALLRWADFGIHLSRPWEVVLGGRPNAGKSSLINALVGFARSIVHDQPGTTRDVVTAETAFDGWPVRLADTAGIRAEGDELEQAGIGRARERFEQADCRVLLVDTSRPPQEADRRMLTDWPDAIVVAHKCDLPDAWGRERPAAGLRVSSVTGDGVAELSRTIVARLVPEVPPAGVPPAGVPTGGTAIPVTPRQVKLLLQARDAAQAGDAAQVGEAVGRILDGPDA